MFLRNLFDSHLFYRANPGWTIHLLILQLGVLDPAFRGSMSEEVAALAEQKRPEAQEGDLAAEGKYINFDAFMRVMMEGWENDNHDR